MEATLAEPGFSETIQHGRANLACLLAGEFGPDNRELAFHRCDDEDMAEEAELDALFPGWTWRIVLDGEPDDYVPTVPSGPDVLDVFPYRVVANFATAEHRDAWRARRAFQEAEARRIAGLVEAARARGVELCSMCASPMGPMQDTWDLRIGRLAMRYPVRGERCTGCGETIHLLADPDGEARRLARPAFDARAGWPGRKQDGVDDSALRDAFHAARRAPPEVVVECLPGMTAADIVAALEAADGPMTVGGKADS